MVLLSLAGGALAHAYPSASSPASGKTVAASPGEVWVDFTQLPDPGASGIELLDANLTPIPTEGPFLNESRITVRPAVPLESGVYLIRWVVLSLADGHTTRGTIPFAVGDAVAPQVEATIEKPPTGPDAIIGKALNYLGLTIVAGALAFHFFVVPASSARWWRRYLFAGALAAALGMALFAFSQVRLSGLPGSTYLLETAYGRGLSLRVSLTVLVLALGVLPARGVHRFPVPHAIAVALGALLLASGFYSHTAGYIAPRWWGAAVDAIHLTTAFAWVGGLGALVLALRFDGVSSREPDRLKHVAGGFSALATFCIAIVALVGFFMLFALTGTTLAQWRASLTEPYGMLLNAKIALFFVMAGMGAANRWLYVAAFERGRKLDHATAFRRSVAREVAVGVAVLVLAAGVTNLSPPDFTAPEASRGGLPPVEQITSPALALPLEMEMHGSHFAFHLVVEPGPRVGQPSTFRMRLYDHHTGEDVRDATVALLLKHRTSPELGATPVPLEDEDGVYVAQGSYFAVGGPWRIEASAGNATIYSDETLFNVQVEGP